jgi:FKBP-type peptidyl-prolyl cis-trans isomerase FkpA
MQQDKTRSIIIVVGALMGAIMAIAVFLNSQQPSAVTTTPEGSVPVNIPAAQSGDYQTTASGLQYRVVTEGTGARPAATDTVNVHYRGTLADGTQFDSSYERGEPISFPLNGVIAGWTEGVQLMTVGSTYEFIIPPALAYGAQGIPGAIPPNATLTFVVELLAIE